MAHSPFIPPLTITTPSHTLILSEATPAEIPSFCTICYDAYATDPMLHATYGTASPAAIIASNIKRWELDWPRPGRHVYKAVDAATGEIVAVAKWVFPHTPTPPPAALAKVGFPEGVNMALLGAFFARSLEKRERWMEWEDMYRASLFTFEMNLLAVLPAYQRLGIGQAMLASVLKLADEEGRRVFVEATPEGARLYRKFGWVECDERLRFYLAEFKVGEGMLETTLFLMREPGAGRPGM
ncbi:hypothetical protein VE02_07101 [Pseudogymnoascus sp. 03VT05]|nr:hypothetical protein VE02_07101 [Pseudogymnoascus sp. 03VT05]